METAAENRLGYEDIKEGSGNDCPVRDPVAEAHTTKGSKIFSTIDSPLVRLKSRANVLVSDVFRRSQAAESDDDARLEKIKNDVKERLKREIEKVDMESNPRLDGDTGFCV
jgi:hypothetical protein